jgi:acetoin utilization deacetylase AcuC-like enzyme
VALEEPAPEGVEQDHADALALAASQQSLDRRGDVGEGADAATLAFSRVHLWTHDRWRFPLPETHRFPIDKYSLLRERMQAVGHELHEAEAVPWPWLEAVHEPELVARIRTGSLTVREQRGLGLPWSPALVERSRRSVAGTIAAARFALGAGLCMNLGGGTHHAGRAFARGYCVFNDVAVALSRVRADGRATRALVVDCDVHQGDGTADLLGPDPDCFTLSLHGARNYPFQRIPSDLDVDIAAGTGDDRYLLALDEALDHAIPRAEAELAFYLAGADPWEGDRLGKLALTKAGLRARDDLVLDRLRAAGAAVCVVLAGGYAEDVRDTVDIHAATAAAVADRVEPGRVGAR